MSTNDVAKKLVELCKVGKNLDAMDQLYDEDILSVEAAAFPGHPAEMRGLDAVKTKSKEWVESNTVHSAEVTGPFPHGDRFAVGFKYDITPKQTGKRTTMDEIGLYTVKNGKIVKEEFFYQT